MDKFICVDDCEVSVETVMLTRGPAGPEEPAGPLSPEGP